MATEEKAKNKSGFEHITEPQIELIKQLYEETQYERQYTGRALEHLTKNEAMKHIDYLKNYKARMLQDQHNQQRVNGFDKISFAMIYKLCWKEKAEKLSAVHWTDDEFMEHVLKQYWLYTATKDYVKEKVRKEAVQ